MKEYIDAGICDATYLWNPIELGYVCGYAAVAMVNGEFDGSVGATIEVPDFEGLEVVEKDDGGTVLFLNKPNAFTKDTVDAWIDIL